MKPVIETCGRGGARPGGFTLLELLVVVGILLILAALILTGVQSASQKVAAAQCLNNMRQLQLCWQMYADDFQDRVAINRSYEVDGVWRSTPNSWIGNSSALHDRDARAIKIGLLFRYDYNRNVEAYRCPADDSFVVAAEIYRTRSYAMNGTFGGNFDPNDPKEVARNISKTTQIRNPSRLFVFLEEHEDSIDDAHFLVWPAPDDRWVNMPSDRHSQSGIFSFADGHAEKVRWKGKKSFQDKSDYFKPVANESDLEDLRRLQRMAHP
jgi:prepilin-type N-terminal cleavage/methylation domain-containing protein/prepilin-type processing-associated H-X9-DG protein